MRASATTISIGLLLLCAQVAFSDGASPNIVALPVGQVPLLGGLVALLVGFVLGLAFGTPAYRLAVVGAIAGSALLFNGMFVPYAGPSAVLGAATWAAAFYGFVRAIRLDTAERQRATDDRR